MLKKSLFICAFAIASVAMSETASADHCYGGYRAPIASYHSGHHGHGHHHRSYRPAYRSNYGTPYRSSYRRGYGGYGYGYGGYGYGGYGYGNRSSIGISRGGVRIGIGF